MRLNFTRVPYFLTAVPQGFKLTSAVKVCQLYFCFVFFVVPIHCTKGPKYVLIERRRKKLYCMQGQKMEKKKFLFKKNILP